MLGHMSTDFTCCQNLLYPSGITEAVSRLGHGTPGRENRCWDSNEIREINGIESNTYDGKSKTKFWSSNMWNTQILIIWGFALINHVLILCEQEERSRLFTIHEGDRPFHNQTTSLDCQKHKSFFGSTKRILITDFNLEFNSKCNIPPAIHGAVAMGNPVVTHRPTDEALACTGPRQSWRDTQKVHVENQNNTY